MAPELTIVEAHRIAEVVEARIRQLHAGIAEVLVHLGADETIRRIGEPGLLVFGDAGQLAADAKRDTSGLTPTCCRPSEARGVTTRVCRIG